MFVYSFWEGIYIQSIRYNIIINWCRHLCYQNLFCNIFISGILFHKIQLTCNVRSIFNAHAMLASIFMLHCISDIQSYLQRQPILNVSFFPWVSIRHSMLSEINVAGFFVSTTGSILCLIYIRLCKDNRQRSML